MPLFVKQHVICRKTAISSPSAYVKSMRSLKICLCQHRSEERCATAPHLKENRLKET